MVATTAPLTNLKVSFEFYTSYVCLIAPIRWRKTPPTLMLAAREQEHR